MDCPACAGQPPPGAAFCPRCGTRCAPEPHGVPEERRVVTVVFCDLVGSTALSGRLDPESLRAVTLRYFTAMREQLEAHGGRVEKYIGDAVMAVFGVPVRHEDDARRALAAALGMTAALDGLNADLERGYGVRLAVRIGVNTGEVVAATDPGARQALVSGEVVNVAARLEQAAGAGEILLGPETAASAGAVAVTEDAGARTLRGTSAPTAARRLLGLRDDDPELVRRFDTRFVGRGTDLAELALLGTRLADDGHARLVTVYGDAGLGKTRLLREWLRGTPPPRRPLYGVGRCRPYGEIGSLVPLATALRQVLDALGATPEQALARVPEPERAAASAAWELLGGGLLADGTPSPSLTDTGTALVCLIAALAEHAADRRPLLLVLDDLHWAADPLLDLVALLLRELPDAPLAVVCAARPELLARRPHWGSGLPRAAALTLTGLRRTEASELAAALGAAEVTAHHPGLAEQALDRAEGNPLYLEHLLATGGAADLDAPPPSVQAVLGARIDALDPPERALLQLAALLGREFHQAELRELAAGEPGPPDAEAVPELLLRLQRRRLLEPVRRTLDGSSALRFGSGLVQETAYLATAKAVRARRHERAAAALGAAAAGGPAPDAAIGTHLERAHRYRAELGGDPDAAERLRGAAAAALHRAGVRALARSDLPWAEDVLTRARVLDTGSAPVARRLAEVRLARGDTADARDLLEEARAAAEAAGDAVTAAHAELGLAVLSPRPGAAAEAVRRTLPVFTAAGDDEGIARAGVRAAQERQRQGRHAAAEALLRKALAHARAAEAEPERATALGALGISLWRGPLPVGAALDRCRALRERDGAGRPAVRATLGCPSAVLLALHGEEAAARATLEEAGRLARELGYAEAAVFVPLFAAELEMALGHWAQVPPLLDEARRAAGDGGGLKGIDRDRARALLELGDPAAALAVPAPSGDGPAEVAWSPAETADAEGLRARALALRGGPDAGARARRRAARSLAAAESTDSPLVRARAALDLAHTLAALGATAAARRAAGAAARHCTAKGDARGAAVAAELGERMDERRRTP